MSRRKRRAPGFEARVALEALKGEETASELASRFGVRPSMEEGLARGASGVSGRGGRKAPVMDEDQVKEQHVGIGGLAVAGSFPEGKLRPRGGT